MAINSVFGPKVFVVYKSSGLGKPSLPNYRLFFGKNVVADLTFADQFCKIRLHGLPDKNNRFQLFGKKDRSVSLYEHFSVLFQKLGKWRKGEAIQMRSMWLFGHTIRGHNMKNRSTLKRSISSNAWKEILYILFLLDVTLHLELLCSPLFDLDSLRLQRNTLGK